MKRALVLLIFVGGFACWLSADSLPDPSVFLEEVTHLGTDHAMVRRDAFAQLEQWSTDFPRATLVRLAIAYAEASDLEVLHQLESLLRPLAIKVLFYQPPAFIGVNYELFIFPDGESAILISAVVPDSPADEVGLRRGDALVEIAGVSITEFSEATGFAEFVQSQLPLQIVPLRVRRGAEEWELDLKLGMREYAPRTMNYMFMREKAKLESWLKGLRPKDDNPDQPVGHFE